MTVRIGFIEKSGPATRFYMEADWTSQDAANNRSLLHVVLVAQNLGNSSSWHGGWGTQYTWWGGGELGRHEANPFLPSGYGYGAYRWIDAWDHWFYHDSAGNHPSVAFGMHLQYDYYNEDHYGSIEAPPRIPKPPSAPGGPSVSGIGPKSATIAFTQPGDNRGSAIDQFQLLVSKNPNPEVSPVKNQTGITNSPVTYNDLEPATTYYTKVRAHNNSYGQWGDWSNTASFTTLSGLYLGIDGTFRGVELLVGKGGEFVTVPEVRVGKGGSLIPAG